MNMTAPGAFHWNELMTHDVAAAKAFYASVCGWTYQDMEVDGMQYTVAMAGDQPAGGLYEMAGDEFKGHPEMWMSYVAVEDADKTADAAAKAGGQIVRPPFDVTGVGRIALLMDKGGASIGVIKPADPPAAG